MSSRNRSKRALLEKKKRAGLNAPSTPRPSKRKKIGPATKEQFLKACSGHQGKEIPTYMRQYLIHLVDTEGLPLQRVFRGLSETSYYNWKALCKVKDSPSPLKKKKTGPSRLHDEAVTRKIGEDMATGKLTPSIRRAAAEVGTSKSTFHRLITSRQVELGLPAVTRKRRTKLSVDKNWPRVIDMQLSFIAGQQRFLREKDTQKRGPRAYSDEFPIRFGEGDGGEYGYSRAGDLYVNPEGYRDETAHAVMCVCEDPPQGR